MQRKRSRNVSSEMGNTDWYFGDRMRGVGCSYIFYFSAFHEFSVKSMHVKSIIFK